ncbi:MAG: response regulator [Pseudomonadales bacterium]|jgi:CheY-like chemotaxis protein|nr:response regulator [Pseudomonadales bacterium]
MSSRLRSSEPLAGACIWVVEDVPALRMLVAARLRRAGADVVEAADGAEVRALLPTARSADVVCLDLGLPDVDGLALAAELGVRRCLAFTASTDHATRERCRRAGLPGLLDKTAAEELVPRLADFLARRDNAALATARMRTPVADDAAELAGRYLQFLAQQRSALKELSRDPWPTDAARVRSIAHRMAGTAVHFGLPGLGAAAKALSVALASEDPRRVRAAFDRLDDALAQAAPHTAAHERVDPELDHRAIGGVRA